MFCFFFFFLQLGFGQSIGRLDSIIEKGISDGAFPSASVVIVRGSERLYSRSYGRFTYDTSSERVTEETLYDIASLTKPLVTLLCAMKLFEEGKIDLAAPVALYLPEFASNKKTSVLVRHLLLHNSGLIPFRRYDSTVSSYRSLVLSVCRESLVSEPGTKTTYSDLNFVLLQEIVIRRAGGRDFDNIFFKTYFEDNFVKPLGLKHTMFNPTKQNVLAPTGLPRHWVLPFERPLVHDPTAAIAGGIAGNAGLFATATDVATLGQIFLGMGKVQGKTFFKAETIKRFTTRITDRALGWDTKTSPSSMCGKHFSYQTYGHLGYTGTSIWIDPTINLMVVFLTNRVYPSPDNRKISAYRPLIHDAIIHALGL